MGVLPDDISETMRLSVREGYFDHIKDIPRTIGVPAFKEIWNYVWDALQDQKFRNGEKSRGVNFLLKYDPKTKTIVKSDEEDRSSKDFTILKMPTEALKGLSKEEAWEKFYSQVGASKEASIKSFEEYGLLNP